MQCRMLHSCNLASSRVSPLAYTFSRRSRSKLCVCRASSLASQSGVLLDFGASQSLSRTSLSENSFSKDNSNGGVPKDEAADLTLSGDRRSQEATDNLPVGVLESAGTSALDEEQRSEKMLDQSSSQEDETESEPLDDDEEPFEPITKINVPKQKYIPISKFSLVRALADSFHDEKKATEFLTICSRSPPISLLSPEVCAYFQGCPNHPYFKALRLLDFILHAEHKTTLEQMRLDYNIIQSALKKEARNVKGKTGPWRNNRKRKDWLKKLWELWNLRKKESKLGKTVSTSMRKQFKKLTPDGIDGLGASTGSRSPSHNEGEHKQGNISTQADGNGTLSSKPGMPKSTSTLAPPDETTRKSIVSAARFQRSFLRLLKNAHFQGLSVRDLQLTSALNTDYLLTLPIEVDWKNTSSEVAIVFRRGYSSERQEGFLFGAKLDYMQSLFLRKILNWFSRPLFRGGTLINRKLKHPSESDGSRSWADEFTEWLKEPLKPETDDELSGMIADSLEEEEKEDDLPVWIAAQQAVPRYEAFLSSVGSRGMMLRNILVWMRILPRTPANLPFSTDADLTFFESRSRGSVLARISMRDIWLPASKVVCGNKLWRRLQAVFSIFFSRSTLQEPAYKELVLLHNVQNAGDADAQDRIPNLQLKIYRKIPIPDLKVIFPNKKLSFRILDTVRLDTTTVVGLLAFLINYRFDDFLKSPSAFLLDIIALSALIVYMSRVAFGYKQTYDRYQLLVNKTLYEKTLASGFGAAQFVVDASEQQQFKECALAFALLMRTKIEKVETQDSLAKKCENFLFSQFKEQVEMPIDDALTNLSRLGLVIEQKSSSTTSGADNEEETRFFQAQSYTEALSTLQDRWTELLINKSEPINFLRSLYQTVN